MSNFEENNSAPKIHVEAPPITDPENSGNHQTPPPAASSNDGVVAGILRRWKREELVKKGALPLRVAALIFSLISFLVMAFNKHGDWRDFDKYDEYRYLLAIAILSSLYNGGILFLKVKGKQLLQPRMAAIIYFAGDQITAYLLLSSASSAIPITNRMRENSDNIFTDSSSTAICMSIFAFICFAVSALISGFKLSTQPYI
ncbi:CASP-like protein [Arachis hypogaea]|nr:CASP-like protein [Arachis hypogaea]